MSDLVQAITAIALAVIGVATLAVIVSKNANTAGVLTSSGQAFSLALGTALSPVTGTVNSSSTFPIS